VLASATGIRISKKSVKFDSADDAMSGTSESTGPKSTSEVLSAANVALPPGPTEFVTQFSGAKALTNPSVVTSAGTTILLTCGLLALHSNETL